MPKKISSPFIVLLSFILLVGLACNAPTSQQQAPDDQPAEPQQAPPVELIETPPPPPPPTAEPPTSTPTIVHVDVPINSVSQGMLVYDVESAGTAPEKRAPYGDSYDIYRMERPFTQDMTYIQDMDIVTFNVKLEEEWIYVSIELSNSNPNNDIGIHYGVELDTNGDGFAEYLIWSNPPYVPQWTTDGVQVYADKNHDTGGLSAEKSDAPLPGDGYEEKLFDSGIGDDPDLAWVRVNAGRMATVQIAFKTSLAGTSFLIGVLSDAGLKDVTRMYYNDRFTEEQAGSPEKSEQYYPLKELYAFDNTCREAFNYSANNYEPMLCPREEPKPQPGRTPQVCQPPPYCTGKSYIWHQDTCFCEVILY